MPHMSQIQTLNQKPRTPVRASESASTTELIGGVGVQYEVIPRLKLEARLGLLGYGSATTLGASYRF
jgi:hypothetical protein